MISIKRRLLVFFSDILEKNNRTHGCSTFGSVAQKFAEVSHASNGCDLQENVADGSVHQEWKKHHRICTQISAFTSSVIRAEKSPHGSNLVFFSNTFQMLATKIKPFATVLPVGGGGHITGGWMFVGGGTSEGEVFLWSSFGFGSWSAEGQHLSGNTQKQGIRKMEILVFFLWKIIACPPSDDKNVKTPPQCMSLIKKLNFIFFSYFRVLPICGGE